MTFLAEGGVTGGKAAFNANALGDRVPPLNYGTQGWIELSELDV